MPPQHPLFFLNRLQNHSEALLAVHLNHYWSIKMDMPQELCLLCCLHVIQKSFVEPSVILKRVDSEVANAKRSQVLKEMRALTRIDAVVFQSTFNNDARIADMRPFDRYSKPRIAASPASRSHKYITFFLSGETAVHLLYLVSNLLRIRRIELLCFHIDDIIDIRHDAMSQNTG